MVGDSLINHLMSTDDLINLSSSDGLEHVLRLCPSYGVQCEIVFSSKKSLDMMIKNHLDTGQKLNAL